MSASHLDAVKKKYQFRDIQFATWRDPRLSVHPFRGGPKSPTVSPQALARPFVPTYKVRYPPPQPTDDEESEDEGEDEDGERSGEGEVVGEASVIPPLGEASAVQEIPPVGFVEGEEGEGETHEEGPSGPVEPLIPVQIEPDAAPAVPESTTVEVEPEPVVSVPEQAAPEVEAAPIEGKGQDEALAATPAPVVISGADIPAAAGLEDVQASDEAVKTAEIPLDIGQPPNGGEEDVLQSPPPPPPAPSPPNERIEQVQKEDEPQHVAEVTEATEPTPDEVPIADDLVHTTELKEEQHATPDPDVDHSPPAQDQVVEAQPEASNLPTQSEEANASPIVEVVQVPAEGSEKSPKVVQFAPGTPEPKQTLRKKRTVKAAKGGKKKKTVATVSEDDRGPDVLDAGAESASPAAGVDLVVEKGDAQQADEGVQPAAGDKSGIASNELTATQIQDASTPTIEAPVPIPEDLPAVPEKSILKKKSSSKKSTPVPDKQDKSKDKKQKKSSRSSASKELEPPPPPLPAIPAGLGIDFADIIDMPPLPVVDTVSASAGPGESVREVMEPHVDAPVDDKHADDAAESLVTAEAEQAAAAEMALSADLHTAEADVSEANVPGESKEKDIGTDDRHDAIVSKSDIEDTLEAGEVPEPVVHLDEIAVVEDVVAESRDEQSKSEEDGHEEQGEQLVEEVGESVVEDVHTPQDSAVDLEEDKEIAADAAPTGSDDDLLGDVRDHGLNEEHALSENLNVGREGEAGVASEAVDGDELIDVREEGEDVIAVAQAEDAGEASLVAAIIEEEAVNVVEQEDHTLDSVQAHEDVSEAIESEEVDEPKAVVDAEQARDDRIEAVELLDQVAVESDGAAPATNTDDVDEPQDEPPITVVGEASPVIEEASGVVEEIVHVEDKARIDEPDVQELVEVEKEELSPLVHEVGEGEDKSEQTDVVGEEVVEAPGEDPVLVETSTREAGLEDLVAEELPLEDHAVEVPVVEEPSLEEQVADEEPIGEPIAEKIEIEEPAAFGLSDAAESTEQAHTAEEVLAEELVQEEDKPAEPVIEAPSIVPDQPTIGDMITGSTEVDAETAEAPGVENVDASPEAHVQPEPVPQDEQPAPVSVIEETTSVPEIERVAEPVLDTPPSPALSKHKADHWEREHLTRTKHPPSRDLQRPDDKSRSSNRSTRVPPRDSERSHRSARISMTAEDLARRQLRREQRSALAAARIAEEERSLADEEMLRRARHEARRAARRAEEAARLAREEAAAVARAEAEIRRRRGDERPRSSRHGRPRSSTSASSSVKTAPKAGGLITGLFARNAESSSLPPASPLSSRRREAPGRETLRMESPPPPREEGAAAGRSRDDQPTAPPSSASPPSSPSHRRHGHRHQHRPMEGERERDREGTDLQTRRTDGHRRTSDRAEGERRSKKRSGPPPPPQSSKAGAFFGAFLRGF